MNLRMFAVVTKAIGIALAVAATCLHGSLESDFHKFGRDIAIIVGLCAFFWICGILLISVVWDFNLNYTIDLMMCVNMACLACAGGALIIEQFSEDKKMSRLTITSGVLALLISFVLVTDAVCNFTAHH